MSRHTPGPWIARQEYANRWSIEVQRDGFLPVRVGIASTTVLEVGCSNEDTACNAQLMAAVPDYFAGVQRMLNAEDAGGDEWWEGWEMVKAAHKKAGGEKFQ